MQSSTFSVHGREYIASRAVDGNADPVFSNGHCSSTRRTYEPWWAVDLSARYVLLNVSLTNREALGKSINAIFI